MDDEAARMNDPARCVEPTTGPAILCPHLWATRRAHAVQWLLTVTREAPLPQTSDASARWVEELRTWATEGFSHILLDFGHVTDTEPVQRFVEEVMAPLR
jgi:hypothetical protein